MRALPLTGAALLLLLPVLLTGCAAADEPDAAPPAQSSADDTPAENDDESDDDADAASADECRGLTTEHLVAVFGAQLQGPEPSTGNSDQNGVEWTSSGCNWEGEEADLEIDLDYSVASDFVDDVIACIEPGGVGDVEAVAGVGTQAWWKFDDLDEVEGELRVCTDDALVELEVDAGTGTMTSAELRDLVVEALQPVLE